MTAIFGVFSLCDEKFCKSNLDLMMQPSDNQLTDTSHVWFDENIAMGQQTWHTTPESFNETLPYHKNGTGLTIAGDIRIDNRAELFTKLGIEKSLQTRIGDEQLVLDAYMKWEEDCPNYLLGDFAFAIWNSENRKLFCCRDHFGMRELFYYYDSRKFVFASDIRSITRAKDIKNEVNYHKLATYVVPDTKNLFRHESWVENILALKASNTITVDKDGLKGRKYWTPAIGTPLVFKNEAVYAEAFKEVFYKAVADRLRCNTPVSALLSGGLDSSAIVSVAAKILEKQNKELQVFSVVLPGENNNVLSDERYYIDQLRAFPNIKIHYITSPQEGFFSGLDKFKYRNDPNASSRHFIYDSFSEKALSIGSRVILDGIGGELGPTNYAAGFYAEQFWRLRWLTLWKELKARKRLVGESIMGNIRSQVIKPFLPAALISLLKIARNGENLSDHYFQPDFMADLTKKMEPYRDEIKKKINYIYPVQRKNQLNALQIMQNKGSGSLIPGRAELRYPFFDKPLLEFCLNAPPEFKIRNGYKRSLVRTGLDGILPPEIQWRNTKTAFSPDYMRRYKAQLPQVKEFFDSIKHNDPIRAIIDIEKLKTWIAISVADDEKNNHHIRIARDLVPQAVYLICFLRRFKEF